MRNIALCTLLVITLVVVGCSSGPKPISISISPTASQALDLAQSFNISAVVSDDNLNKGATFALTGVGALSNQTATGATFTAPTSGTGGSAAIVVASASDPSKTATINVTVTAPPSITTTSLAAGTEGSTYSGSLAVAGGAGKLTYSVSAGSLPAGLTINSSTGAITGTPTGPNGTASFSVKVTDGSTAAPQSATQALTIAINLPPAPVISTTSLPADVEGTAYNQPISVAGGLAPLTYAISSGSLPAGLAISSSSGAITGSPAGPNGTANFTVKVTDSSNPAQSATQALSITVNLPPAPVISTTSLPAGTEGTSYSQPIQATGYGTLTYSVSVGSLPAGLALNSSSGAITGKPSGPNGTISFTIQVADGSNPVQTKTQALSIVVNLPAAPVITTTSLPGVVEFASYNQAVAATGYAPLAYSVSAGALPAGLTLNSSTGAITGSPTGPSGTVNFTVKVVDSSNPPQSVTQALSIAISLPAAPAITTTSLPNATVGGNYSQTIGLTGGHGPFAWSISSGTLPANLTINSGTGVISGTVGSTIGTSNFTVQVVDSSNPAQTASQALSISVVTGPLLVTAATLPTGAVNDVYPNTNLGASGGVPPYTWSTTSGSLPTGMNPLSSAGLISGTPTASGTFNFTAQVKDSTNATATGNFSITVNPALAITTSSLPAGTVGSAYTSTNLNASGGVSPYTWSISAGSLPGGLTLSGNTISGQPTASGTFNFTVKVTDAAGGSQTANLSIIVAAAAPLTITTTSSSLPTGTANTAYPNTQLNASGGIQPYTWTITSGALPTGMNLSSSGQITGTPTATGTANFTVKVTDSATPTANTQSAALSITVNAAAVSCDTTRTGKESLLHGDYAFALSGFDSTGNPAFVGGVFVASGVAGAGNITSGAMDMNLAGGVQSNLSMTTASTYNLGQDSNGGYRGCMVLVTSAGTQHYAFSVDAIGAVTANVASDGHMINFDSAGPFTAGVLRQANPSAFTTTSITGNWAFGVGGPRSSGSGGGKFAAVGVLTFSSGSVSGVADTNDNGTLDSNSSLTAFPTASAGLTLASGAYSIGSNGRGTMTFTPSGSSNSVNSFLYVVSTSEALVMGADSQVNNSSYVGRALKQSGTFSNSSLSGNHVIYASGISTGTSGGSRVEIDLVSTSGTSFTFAGYQNDAGNLQDPTTNSGSGTFSVASNGRVTLGCGACGHLPVFYLSSANTAFFLNSEPHVSSGSFEPQSAGSFSNSSASGVYGLGTINPETSGVGLSSGDVKFTSASATVNVLNDNNDQGTLSPDSTGSDTYAIGSNGIGLLPSGCSFTGGTCDTLIAVISSSKIIAVDAKPANGTNHMTPVIYVVQQ